MARRRKHNYGSDADANDIANDPFHQSNIQTYLRSLSAPAKPSPLSDLRVYHPLANLRPAAATDRSARQVRERSTFNPRRSLFGRFEFITPKAVVVCMRRKVRKEVWHALKLKRRGRGSYRPRLTQWSKIKC